jgi:hypothetical protein
MLHHHSFKGFLTAMRQEVTRMHKGWSLDTVTIDNHVLRSYKDDIREPPTEVTNSYNSPTSFSLF